LKKVCRKCHVEKSIEKFPKHFAGKDGHLNHCQDCINADVRARNALKPKVKKIKPTREERLAAIPFNFQLKCNRCLIEKPLAEFRYSELGKYGVRRECRECELISITEAYRANPEIGRQKTALWIKNNPGKAREVRKASYIKHRAVRLQGRKEWRAKNLEKDREREKRYLKNNRPVVYAKNARRRAAETQSVPPWLNFIQKAQIKEFYEIAAARAMQTGVKHHVDHIVPLRGDGVNGLHVPWNLQVLTEFENCSKHNRIIEGSM
jgi:hypothetical protein